MTKLGLRPPPASQIHLSFHHHSHRDNVTAPTGRPNLRSRLHFGHSRGGGPRSLRGHVVALGGEGGIVTTGFQNVYPSVRAPRVFVVMDSETVARDCQLNDLPLSFVYGA